MKAVQHVLLLGSILLAAMLVPACTSRSDPVPARPPVQLDGRAPGTAAADGVLSGVSLPRTASSNTVSSFTAFEGQLGVPVDIAHYFRRWEEPLVTDDIVRFASIGVYPMVSWNGSDIDGIVDHTYDSMIADAARAIARTRAPVFLRFRWEMNRPNLRDAMGSPERYVEAWRLVHDTFVANGAQNVAWVWCPTAEGFAPGGDAAAFYPGDEYVDWLCADAYPDADLPSFEVLLQPFLSWAADHPQPVMIGEFGVPRTASDEHRAAWLQAATQFIQTRHDIRAVVYFDLDVRPDARILQFGLSNAPSTLRAFRGMVTSLSRDGQSPATTAGGR